MASLSQPHTEDGGHWKTVGRNQNGLKRKRERREGVKEREQYYCKVMAGAHKQPIGRRLLVIVMQEKSSTSLKRGLVTIFVIIIKVYHNYYVKCNFADSAIGLGCGGVC